MKLKALTTQNFRNLLGNPPSFCDGINVLYGDNAAGKTNTLEAIYLFATGKSFRTKNEKDFIRHTEEFARLEIEFEGAGADRRMSVAYLSGGAKTTKAMQIEGIGVERVSEFLGNFRAVLFTPDHLELVKGAPEERRRLVDMALCQIQPRFIRSLNEYAKLLAQRNNYLKGLKFSGKEPDLDYIDVLNMQLSKVGATVTKQRALYCEKLCSIASGIYARLAGGEESLDIKYVSRIKTEDFSDENLLSQLLYEMYKSDTPRDIELCKTSHGPHHDELMIYLRKKGERQSFDEMETEELTQYAARTFGSQGQQRSAVLAIKLSEGEIIKEKCGEYPVFLLDDLFSELDDKRRKKLTEMFCDKQCIITCCDRAAIPDGIDMNVICVENGRYKN